MEDLLTGLPVLQHLGFDTKTLLEQRRDVLGYTDFSRISHEFSTKEYVSHLMIARLNNIAGGILHPPAF